MIRNDMRVDLMIVAGHPVQLERRRFWAEQGAEVMRHPDDGTDSFGHVVVDVRVLLQDPSNVATCEKTQTLFSITKDSSGALELTGAREANRSVQGFRNGEHLAMDNVLHVFYLPA